MRVLSSSRVPAPPIVHDVLRSRGWPLGAGARASMERRFGHDFSRVRVHTDTPAAESARAVTATAYTVGDHIVFASGRYAPGTPSGDRLLAHELAHVVQQRGSAFAPGSSLLIGSEEAPYEREAETAATRTVAPRLSPTSPILARQARPPCTLNCTDPAFLALSIPAREAQLRSACPQGFPSGGNTFFGNPIPAATGATLKKKLNEAETLGKGAVCVAGRDPATVTVPGILKTYPSHQPAEDKAVDIDATGQPYVMHEWTKDPTDPTGKRMVQEADIDRETAPVYNRIAFWGLYRTSIIPTGITTVTRASGPLGSQRRWTNPKTGQQESITTGEIYDLLKQESTRFRSYFELLGATDAELADQIDIFLMFNTDPPATLTRLGLPINNSSTSVVAFRRRIADDYRLLGGTAAGLTALAGHAVPSTTPPSHVGDRPFVGRRPELGFLTMPREVLVAMTDVGLTWGAIDFPGGVAAGDLMHVDCRGLPGC
jgi:hypothetical protein